MKYKISMKSTRLAIETGFDEGDGDLKDGFNQAREWASDKIAP
jgi:hypothetical protein